MPSDGLTVAVTGPTGDLGVAIVAALERSRRARRIVGMARRPFEPTELGWRRTEYRQGDVTDARSVRDLVRGADVVIHLAFAVMSASEETRALNVEGSRIVFEESARAGVERVLYSSSVAAYGFHADNPDWLTEDVPPRGSPEHRYSEQKAEVEQVLSAVLRGGRGTAAYVYRPCIVAGPHAQTLLEQLPYLRLSDAIPGVAARLIAAAPVLRPVLPNPGVPFQLVHEDDVAQAFMAGVAGRGEPGAYNLAAPDPLSVADLANALGWYSVPVAPFLVQGAAEVATRLPAAPDSLAWLHSMRTPVLMRTDRARRQLRWRPRHSGRETLAEAVAAYRACR